ncbi:MAG: hypothetical protein GY859_15760 [Desulfobacterales bacterium]|nr:hypothetical protein [Desulfobacterales bacterium]
MRKLRLFVSAVVLLVFVVGCGAAAKESEFWENDTMYKNMDHLKYSWFGFKETSSKDVEKTKDQAWWGKEISYEFEE